MVTIPRFFLEQLASGNQIGAEGTKLIAKALHRNSSLTSLNLHCKFCCFIFKLIFSANIIGADGAKEILDALQINVSLIELNLRGDLSIHF